MVKLGQDAGLKVSALLTDMSTPLGRKIGNALEVEESVEVLAGGGPSDVVDLTVMLAEEMLRLAGVSGDVRAALNDGRAMDKWNEMISAQGGDPKAPLPKAKHSHVVLAESDGVLEQLDALAVGVASWRLGAGRARKEDVVQLGAGVELHAVQGAVEKVVHPSNLGQLFVARTDGAQLRLTVLFEQCHDSSHVYPLMFSARRRYSDNDVSNDTGILYYDHTKESFMIGSEDKLRNAGTKGSFIQFNEKDHSIHAEGPMDFGLESEHIKFKNAGHADLKPGDSSFSFNLAMMLDFPLPDEFVKYLLSKVVDPEEPGTADLNTDFFKDALGEMVAEPKVYRNIIQGIEKNNKLEGKAEANYKLILSDATFRWDNKMRGMYCNDNVIVASIAGEPVNKEMKAVMLLESKRAGENMYVYLNYGDDYVFFNISKNKCAIYASDPKLTEILVNSAEKIKAKDYYIIQTTERNVDKFLRKIER
jgi:hypothetical protein